jgi:YegS/Rv2252/BmrU family lipid kinase
MAVKSRKRALFIVNPNARNGRKPVIALRKTLEAGGLKLVDAERAEGETLSAVISRMREACDLVIIGGGDGTLNSAAAGIVDTGLPLGVLPLGTANDFARTIGIPADPIEAARLILSTTPRSIDLGEVNGHLFFNVASIGFSAELAGELTKKAKKRWGKLGYAIVGARLLARSRLFTAYVEHDGSVEEIRTMQVSVGNGRHYGGGMTVEATATADDGRLDFYSLEVDHWWRLLSLLPSLRKGTHGRWDDVRAFQTTEIIVKTSKPRAVDTDGELTTWTPAHFRICEQAIRVFAPTNGN